MAQKQYTTYQADILSFELRDALLGVLKPGRYTGFNLMSEYQAESGNNIYCRFSHTTGINKYDKASPPVLEAQRGIVVSTQGTVIAEDGDVDITIVSSTVFGDIYHLIYMEHEYTEVQGANPATYGVITGSEGGGRPALTSPTNRIILGYVLQTYYGGGIDFNMLEWIPYQSEGQYGDHSLAPRLWGSEAEFQLLSGELGAIPSDGMIGNRNFNSNHYITDNESITSALGDLDTQADVEETARIALGNRAIDSSSWGGLTDITTQNVTVATHGLIPKLPNDSDQIFNGIGNWVDIHNFIDETIWVDSPANVFNIGDFVVGSSGTLDFSGLVPVGTKAIIMDVYAVYGAGLSGSQFVQFWKGGFSASGGTGFIVGDNATMLKENEKGQFTIPLSSSRTMSWAFATTQMDAVTIRLLGWVI